MLVRKVANAIFYAISYAVSKGWFYLQQTRIAKYARTWLFASHFILVPRAHDPFGLRQGSRPLAGTEAGSPRITDFRLLCAASEI